MAKEAMQQVLGAVQFLGGAALVWAVVWTAIFAAHDRRKGRRERRGKK